MRKKIEDWFVKDIEMPQGVFWTFVGLIWVGALVFGLLIEVDDRYR